MIDEARDNVGRRVTHGSFSVEKRFSWHFAQFSCGNARIRLDFGGEEG
jgi:hypothetical protein